MPTTLIRTVLLYLLIVAAMKIMGKRQIGQLQLSELVTVTLLSELCSFAILDTDTPIFYSIVPVIVLIGIEVTISFLSVKSRFFSRLFDGNPAYIIYKGILSQRELLSSRLSMTEVISEIRAAGINSLSEVYYMILEPSGKVTVIPRADSRPVTPSDLKLKLAEEGIDHALIFDGKLVSQGLRSVGKDKLWLEKELRRRKVGSVDEVFYFAVNDNEDITFIKKDRP